MVYKISFVSKMYQIYYTQYIFNKNNLLYYTKLGKTYAAKIKVVLNIIDALKEQLVNKKMSQQA